ncbi:MAG: hypothetical protein PHH77_09415 [Victivallaceae bacterium]|nr:hypothetical protein [Victivallaceae bacterium]
MSPARKIVIFCLLSVPLLNGLRGQGSYNYSRSLTYPLPKITMERLGESALRLAKQKLAVNGKDSMGLLLLNFANHLIPHRREVLLVRGKLKFAIPIDPPRRKMEEKDFLLLLSQARDHINDSDTSMNRHLLIILNQLIRSFNPEEEDAIIALMKFTDKGIEIDLDKLLAKKLDSVTDVKFDPKDSRYAVSNITRSVAVPANVPWTDTWIKIRAGKMIRITARGTWSMGDVAGFPTCDPEGYTAYDVRKIKRWSVSAGNSKKVIPVKSKRSGAPGCLLAKIGTKEYYIGSQITFQADNSGVLYLGPYEWDDYLDNSGELSVNIEVYD